MLRGEGVFNPDTSLLVVRLAYLTNLESFLNLKEVTIDVYDFYKSLSQLLPVLRTK